MLKCSSLLKEIDLHCCWPRFTLSTWKVPQLSGHGFVPEYLKTLSRGTSGLKRTGFKDLRLFTFPSEVGKSLKFTSQNHPLALQKANTPPPKHFGGSFLIRS